MSAGDPIPDSSGAAESAVRQRTRRFLVIAELGEGGMARVHLAVARGPGGVNKLVVLKTLRSHLAGDPECLEMFLHEARLAARLNHPNVVQTYEVTEDAGRQVLVMEYLDGQPLSQIFTRASKIGQLATPMYLQMLCGALAGLHYAHELKDFDGTPLELVHRDVSPQNIFVTYDGQVKILDFGIAKARVNAPKETEAGVLKGKVRYMAPEQIAGDAFDRRADIFAVGAVLWEVLAGTRIWSGVPDMTVMNRVTAGDIPSPRTINADVTESLERVCLKAMSLEPSHRYATAEEFQIALEEALGEIGGSWKQRDLGGRISELFAETRANIRATIEEQMRRVEELGTGQRQSLEPVPLFEGASMGAPPGTGSARSHQSRVGLKLRRRWPAAVVLGAAAAGLLVWSRHHGPVPRAPEAETPSTTAAGRPSATESPAPSEVHLNVRATPEEAHFVFDGADLPSNPYAGSFPKDAAEHQLRCEARGYVAQSVDVMLDRDVNVSIALERERALPKPQPPPRVPLAAPRSTPPVPTSSLPAKPNCAQPYYFDEQGIKKIRPECL